MNTTEESVVELVEKASTAVENLSKRQTEIESRLKSIDGALDDLAQRSAVAGRTDLGRNASATHPATEIFKDAGFKAVAARKAKSCTIPLSAGLDRLTKSALIADSNSSDGPGYSVLPHRMPGLMGEPRRALTLLDALPNRIPVGSNSFTFNRLSGYTRSADYQEEGQPKAEQNIASDLVQVNIATIAVWNQASEQVLADEPALRQQIGTMLAYGVRRKLETEIIVGAGGPGEILGLLDASNHTSFAASTNTTTHADVIGEALAALDSAGWVGSLIVLSPADWHAVRSLRAGGSEEYLAGSFAAPAAPSIWSVPVVTCPALTAGTFIVMDTSQVAVLDRMQAQVDIGYHSDGFIRNLLTIRAEMRAGLAVFDPSAVLVGDLY